MKLLNRILIVCIFSFFNLNASIAVERELIEVAGYGLISPLHKMLDIDKISDISRSKYLPKFSEKEIKIIKEIFRTADPKSTIETIKSYDGIPDSPCLWGILTIENKKYNFTLFLGGVGLLDSPDRRRGMFSFDSKLLRTLINNNP